jgi:hypothetical protein
MFWVCSLNMKIISLVYRSSMDENKQRTKRRFWQVLFWPPHGPEGLWNRGGPILDGEFAVVSCIVAKCRTTRTGIKTAAAIRRTGRVALEIDKRREEKVLNITQYLYIFDRDARSGAVSA